MEASANRLAQLEQELQAMEEIQVLESDLSSVSVFCLTGVLFSPLIFDFCRQVNVRPCVT